MVQNPQVFNKTLQKHFKQPSPATLKASSSLRAYLHKGILRTKGTPTEIYVNTPLQCCHLVSQSDTQSVQSDAQHLQTDPSIKTQD